MISARSADIMRAPSPQLPPRELWLYNPDTDGPLETPLDHRGLVDLNALVALGVSTIDPTFKWTSEFNDIHHLQWHAAYYPRRMTEQGVDYGEFRELVNRKVYIPRTFHNWLHRLTLPSSVPSIEAMHYSIDAQRIAKKLSQVSNLAVNLTRRPYIPGHRLAERLEQEFENYNVCIGNARLIPDEFQLFEPSRVEARSVEEMLQLNKAIGKKALDKVPVRLRSVLAA